MSLPAWHNFLEDPAGVGVAPGMIRDEVRDLLGVPSTWSGGAQITAKIWKYGGVEVHFDAVSNRVAFVYTDDPAAIAELGHGLELGITIGRAQAALVGSGLSVIRKDCGPVEDAACLSSEAGIRLLFERLPENSMDALRLHAIMYDGAKTA